MKLTNDDIVLLERMVDNCRENTNQAIAKIVVNCQIAATNKWKKKKEKLDILFDEYFKGWDKLNELSAKLQMMRNK